MKYRWDLIAERYLQLIESLAAKVAEEQTNGCEKTT
jgi:hypothetical protein